MRRLLVFVMGLCFSLVAQEIEYSYAGGLSRERLESYKDRFNFATFIETGAIDGQTAKNASLYAEKVYSFVKSDRFLPRVQMHLEDTSNAVVIPGDNFFQFKYCIAKKGAKSTLLFLDFAGKGARNRWGQIDLSDEFLLLKDYVCRDTIIIIDDIHCFQTDMCCIKKGYYPHLREIEQFVKKQLNGFDFYIIGDQAIIYNPSYFGEAASQGVKLLTKLYLCSSYGEFKKLAALVPETFTEKERVAIYQMYENHSSCGMASFLYGIYEKHAGNRENMKSGFKLAIEWGIKRQVMEPYR